LDDYLIVSGQQDWDAGAIRADMLVTDHGTRFFETNDRFGVGHETGRIRLIQDAPGTFDFNGRNTIEFWFDEGVSVLGVGIYGRDNNAGRRAFHSFIRGRAGDWTTSARGYDFEVLVRENSVSVRPLDTARNTGAGTATGLHNIGFEFFLSVEPGFADANGDTITVDISGRALGDHTFSNVPLATVVDPISVNVNRTRLEDVGGTEVAFGRVFNAPVADVTIREMSLGALESGRLAISMEDLGVGGFRVDLTAARAYVVNSNETSVQISPLRSRGGVMYVDVLRTGTDRDDEPAVIRFAGVRVSGDVFRGHTYNILVTGDSVAANFIPLGALVGHEHGFFQTSYTAPLFYFVGDVEIGVTEPPVDPPTRPGVLLHPVILTNTITDPNRNYNQATMMIVRGLGGVGMEAVVGPFFRLVGDTGYVPFRVVAEIFGLTSYWNPVTYTATFVGEDQDGRAIRIDITRGSATALVNGQSVTMQNSANVPAPALLIDGRTMVPIRFFEHPSVNLGNVQWDAGIQGVIVYRDR
jgi:hypothetical protein